MDIGKIHKEKMAALKGAWEAADSGQDYSPFLKKLNHYQLLELAADKLPDMNHVRIVANGPGGRICPACEELGEKVLRLSSEIENQTLPNKACTCTAYSDEQTGFCLCYYEVVFDDEL